MPPPNPSDIFAEPQKWALFLDLDGTLIDLAPEPEKITIPPGLPRLLTQLDNLLDGAMALNTGRQLAIVDRMLSPLRFAGAGVHGTELRFSRDGDISQLVPPVPKALGTEIGAAAFTLDPDIIVEDKRVGIAVHFRHAPARETDLRVALERVVSGWPDFELRPGRKVLEIIARGLSKATAIEQFLALPSFCGRLPIVIGDDVGDGPALALARRIGGFGMTVAGEHFSHAAATFADPASVRAWLEHVVQPQTRNSPLAGVAAKA